MAIDRGTDTITLDVGVPIAIEERWGGGVLFKYREGRIHNCGILNLRGESDFDPSVTSDIFTNIDVKSFDVLPMDISDHYPLHMVASLPRWPELESCKMELFGCQQSAQELLASWCPTSEGKRVLRELEHPAGAHKKHQFARHAVSHVVPLIFAEVPRSP